LAVLALLPQMLDTHAVTRRAAAIENEGAHWRSRAAIEFVAIDNQHNRVGIGAVSTYGSATITLARSAQVEVPCRHPGHGDATTATVRPVPRRTGYVARNPTTARVPSEKCMHVPSRSLPPTGPFYPMERYRQTGHTVNIVVIRWLPTRLRDV
jgi:hypothetical protein